jgi:excisionase family DNA binding protein
LRSLAEGLGNTVVAKSSPCKFWLMTTGTTGREPDKTVRQVADALGLHPETVRIMARSGDFPNAYKTGRGNQSNHIRIPWADVEAYRKKQPRVNR